VRHTGGWLCADEYLKIDGILDLVGMVSAGKSTPLDVLAVCAARSGLHTTLVGGDVRSVLRKVELFTVLGIEAAPVLRSTTLSTHLERQRRQERGEFPSGQEMSSVVSAPCISDAKRWRVLRHDLISDLRRDST
jgi:hypothetical protein